MRDSSLAGMVWRCDPRIEVLSAESDVNLRFSWNFLGQGKSVAAPSFDLDR